MYTAKEVHALARLHPDWRAGQAVFNALAAECGRAGLPEGGSWGTLFYRCITPDQAIAELARHNLLVGPP